MNPAILVLVDFALAHIDAQPMDRQILLYQAIADVTDDPARAAMAREIAAIKSEAASLQLDFRKLIGQ